MLESGGVEQPLDRRDHDAGVGAVAGGVADAERERAVLAAVVVVVAADLGCGAHRERDLDVGQLRQRRREQRELEAARRFELAGLARVVGLEQSSLDLALARFPFLLERARRQRLDLAQPRLELALRGAEAKREVDRHRDEEGEHAEGVDRNMSDSFPRSAALTSKTPWAAAVRKIAAKPAATIQSPGPRAHRSTDHGAHQLDQRGSDEGPERERRVGDQHYQPGDVWRPRARSRTVAAAATRR